MCNGGVGRRLEAINEHREGGVRISAESIKVLICVISVITSDSSKVREWVLETSGKGFVFRKAFVRGLIIMDDQTLRNNGLEHGPSLKRI